MSNVPQNPPQQQVMALIVEFRLDKPPSIPLNIVALPVSPYLPLNGLVDKIEFYYAQQAMKYGEIEELQVIYLESKTSKTTQFNYNMPVKTYFSHGDTILCHGEIVRAAVEPMEMKEEKDKLPVTIITGFLGSGKTTLLNRILKEKHGKRIMVIQNEFGSIEIDGTLAEDAMFSKEDIQILDNGCACCTVRGDLGKAFGEILEKSNESDVNIEHIIVETTGLANPAPIIQTFYQERNVAMSLKLDGILTVIDAKNVLKHIDEVPLEGKVNECVEQVSFADRILMNKMDLVTGAEARIVKDKIRSINAFAKIIPTTQSKVELSKILNIRAFSLEKLLERDADFLKEDESESEHTCDESDCSQHEHEGGEHSHDKDHVHHKHGEKSHDHAEDKDHVHHKHGEKSHEHAEDKDHVHHKHGEKSHDHAEDKDHVHHKHGEKSHEHAEDKAKDDKHHHKHEKVEKHSHKDQKHSDHDHDHHEHEAGEESTKVKDDKPKKKHKHKHKHKRKSKKNRTQQLQHSSGVSSLGFEREGEVIEERFEQFMSSVIRYWGANIYRTKGIINIYGNPNKLVFHGVHELFDTNNDTPWGKDDKRTNKLVFIGKDLQKEILQKGFSCCLKESATSDQKMSVDADGVTKRPLNSSGASLQPKKPRIEGEGVATEETA